MIHSTLMFPLSIFWANNVVRDMDPLGAVKLMSQADHFFMSNSALSLLGAVLNRNGLVVFPPKMEMSPNYSWLSAKSGTIKSEL